MDHHWKCAKAQAWDISDVPCSCPFGWPRTVIKKIAPTDFMTELLKLASEFENVFLSSELPEQAHDLLRLRWNDFKFALIDAHVDAHKLPQEGKEIAVCQRCKQPVHWHKIKCHYDCTECGHINGSAVLLTLTDTVVDAFLKTNVNEPADEARTQRIRELFDRKQLLARVENYLGNGGFFNPELMEHDKVRALVMDLAAALSEIGNQKRL